MDNQQSDNVDANPTVNNKRWERGVLENLAMAAVTEQRTARRWSIFFKTLVFIYLFIVGGMALYPKFSLEFMEGGSEHTAIIDIIGVIAEGEISNAEAIIIALREALKDINTKGVILNINSPGGSPVQASNVFTEIKRLKEKYPKIPIYSVITDIGASGGYYIAAATDKIYVNQSSIVGSIGVIMNGFGFVGMLDKLGIDRRLIVAGKHKAMLDPFSSLNEYEQKHIQTLMQDVHEQFINAVKIGRGNRLTKEKEVFSGLIWTGTQSIKLGLADGFGSVDSVAREVIGTQKTLNFMAQQNLLDKIIGKLGILLTHTLLSVANELSMQWKNPALITPNTIQ